MKLTRGRLAKIQRRNNESHKVSQLKPRKRNVTCSAFRKKMGTNLHNKTLKKIAFSSQNFNKE